MKKAVVLLILALIIGFIYIRFENQSVIPSSNKIKIVASFYPLAEFAQVIGGEKVEVFNVTPAGSEPHDFEPTPQDLINIQNSRIFIYNSINFQPWVEKIIPDLQKKSIEIVNSSTGVDLIINKDTQIIDPHFWLDPQSAMIQIKNITAALIKVDSSNVNYYQTNSQNYLAKLQNLNNEYKQTLSNCQNKQIVISHQTLAYLGRRYDINIYPITGVSPDEEPSPKKLAELSDFVKQKHIQYIFFETLVSPKLAQTIAQEDKIKTIIYNPLEGLTQEEIKQGKNYLSVQQENLQNIKTALNCQ